jgi:hypothetical protein
MKYVLLNSIDRVIRVADALPSNVKEAEDWTECSDDNVYQGWWYKEATDEFLAEKEWTYNEAWEKRQAELLRTDWCVGADSPLAEAVKDKIKTHRQALRDLLNVKSSWSDSDFFPEIDTATGDPMPMVADENGKIVLTLAEPLPSPDLLNN